MSSLEVAIRHTLVRTCLLEPGQHVLLGVSGGADSIALLHLLAAQRGELALTLVAAYVDHGLRPLETPAEWHCVRAAAAGLEIESVRLAVDVPGAIAAGNVSPEQAARELRYQALAELGRARQTDLLAVAHTADDQAEEVLLRLFRGGGRKALAGMAPRSGTLIRPLLGVRKAALLDYLHAKGIGFCHDSSNDDLRFLRNRIRHHLLPLLERDYDPGIRQALLKTAANLGEDEDLLAGLLADCWPAVVDWPAIGAETGEQACLLRREPFRALHPALQRRLVERLLWDLGAAARYEQILAVLAAARTGRTGSELHLSRGLRVGIRREHLVFVYPRGHIPWRGRLRDG